MAGAGVAVAVGIAATSAHADDDERSLLGGLLPSSVSSVVEDTMDGVAGAVDPITEPIRDIAEPVTEPVRQATKPAEEVLGETVERVEELAAPVTRAVEPIVEGLDPVVEPIVESVRPVVEDVVETSTSVTEPVGETVRTVTEAIKPVVPDVPDLPTPDHPRDGHPVDQQEPPVEAGSPEEGQGDTDGDYRAPEGNERPDGSEFVSDFASVVADPDGTLDTDLRGQADVRHAAEHGTPAASLEALSPVVGHGPEETAPRADSPRPAASHSSHAPEYAPASAAGGSSMRTADSEAAVLPTADRLHSVRLVPSAAPDAGLSVSQHEIPVTPD